MTGEWLERVVTTLLVVLSVVDIPPSGIGTLHDAPSSI